MSRDEHGVAHVSAEDWGGVYWGMGHWHAVDRGLQMLLMRMAGRGQLSQHLNSSDAMLGVDRFFRQMNFAGNVEPLVESLPEATRGLCEAYCEGVNAGLAKRIPWELRWLGYRPDPWTVADSLMLGQMTAYLSLAQSQAEVEHLMLEMVQAGVPRPMLDELFPGLLDGLDEDLIRKVKLGQRVVPDSVRWNPALPCCMASNNWVVAGSKTASGKPILANDPHLDTNRLPNIWYEIALKTSDRYAIGSTMPGLPAVILGRTTDLAWGVTYAFMDTVDSWVERCRDGQCFREPDQWAPLQRRVEIMLRKGKTPAQVTFYENEHGILDGNPLQEGHYLATRWSGSASGVASIVAFAELLHATDVPQGMNLLGQVESAWNWVLADRQGNIGYQMSGLMPRRQGANGFLPLPGWKKENDWIGMVPPGDLPRCLNPAEGFFITANNDLNAFGRAKPINIAMGDHRAERIRSLLVAKTGLTAANMFAIQYDVYSAQAERFMSIIRPLLPETPQGRILRDWDLRYTTDSQGAFLFEQVYTALLREVFGRKTLGIDAADFLSHQSSMLPAFFANFDRILLSERSAWFGSEPRDVIYRRVIAEALTLSPRPWGEAHQMTMRHLLLDGRFPRFLGFDRGPYPIPGGRATVCQTQVFHSRGRPVAVTPSVRMVTDLAEDQIHTNLAGGVSDRRFSRWYASDVANWLTGVYKTIRP